MPAPIPRRYVNIKGSKVICNIQKLLDQRYYVSKSLSAEQHKSPSAEVLGLFSVYKVENLRLII